MLIYITSKNGFSLIENTSVNRYNISAMIIDDLLKDKKMSHYKLSKESGVPQTTIADICSGKAKMEKCSAITLYKLAKVLDVTVDQLLEADMNNKSQEDDYRSSFEIFKSNVCHHVKDMGALDFIIDILENDTIRKLYNKKWYPEALYLLGMLDYLSKLNDLPICTNYNDIRKCKLAKIVYPSGILITAAIMNDEKIKEEAVKKAIPEFMRFNIVENEVDKVA